MQKHEGNGEWAGSRRGRGLPGLFLALVCVSCVTDAVRWDAESPLAREVPSDARLVFEPGRVPLLSRPWAPPNLPAGIALCAASFVAVQARGDTAFAAWWAPRRGGSALLAVARSTDGGRVWHEAVAADSTDRGRTGCARPAPFLSWDAVNGYVHVAYFLVAPEGPGVFVTHSMEGGTMFHAPVPIVYGERPSAAAVASHGDTVVVAYEDPNASVPQLSLALSTLAGHIFDRRVSVSSANMLATRPAVSLNGNRVAVAWLSAARGGGAGSYMLRTGTLHW